MKKFFVSILLLPFFLNAQNSMLGGDFWKSKPTIEIVKQEINKGNNPAEANRGNHDVVSFAINNDADLETIKFLIEQPGNSVSKTTHDGRLYIHWAASRGNVALIKHLIKLGSDINRTDDKGATPLTFAASNGQMDPTVYETFFAAGIDPNQKYQNGANILHLAIPYDTNFKLTEFLTQKGLNLKDADELGRTTFDYAARNGNLDLLKSLIQKGVKPTGNALIFAAQGSRAKSNGLDVFKYLIEEVKLKANATGENGENVLHHLVRKKDQNSIIEFFMQKGVDINTKDKAGNSAFMALAGTKELDLIQSLLPKVKNINETNAKGETALFAAIQTSSPEIVNLLLQNKANIHSVSKEGNLAVALVQSYKAPRPGDQNKEFSDKLSILSQNGLNLAQVQKDGSTLYHVAIVKNDLNLLKSLEPYKIDINAIDKNGMTVLHKAAMMAKDEKILQYLLSLGADKSIKTEFDESAFDLASENEFLKENKVEIDFLK